MVVEVPHEAGNKYEPHVVHRSIYECKAINPGEEMGYRFEYILIKPNLEILADNFLDVGIMLKGDGFYSEGVARYDRPNLHVPSCY